MKEDLLHFVWLYKKYPVNGLRTTDGEKLHVTNPGRYNKLSGPDFFNGRVTINEQLWAGNIEIHVKSSDWYAHNHQYDKTYDNVILHVVWEDDIEVFRKDGTRIPTLALKDFISRNLLERYQDLFAHHAYKFINCEKDITAVDNFVLENWLERVYIERLERKADLINDLLKLSNYDWEQVLFMMLLKNFGSKINGAAFLELAKQIDFKVVRKLQHQPIELESLLMGQAGLLSKEVSIDAYYKELKVEYAYIKHKFALKEELYSPPDFFKLRPGNFPTIRLSQLAVLYARSNTIFQDIIDKGAGSLKSIFNVGTNPYWETHYTFNKESKKSKKMISATFLDLLVINTVVPILFCYQKYQGGVDNELIFTIISKIKSEDNSILKKFKGLGLEIPNAKSSQAYLQLYNEYCVKDKCLECRIGASILNLKA